MVNDDFCSTLDGVLEKTFEKMGRDIDELFTRTADSVDGAVSGFASDDVLKASVSDAYRSSHQNARAFKDALRKQYVGLQDYLNEKSKTEQGVGVVGFFDGFCHAYLGTETARRKSEVYRTHVKYGKVFGYGSAALLFLNGRGVTRVLGTLPIVSRVVRYVNKTIKEAHQEVAAEYAMPPKHTVKAKPAIKSKRKAPKRKR